MRTITLIGFGTLSLFASSAMAGLLSNQQVLPDIKTITSDVNYPVNNGPETETVVMFDVSGIPSWDAYGAPANARYTYDLAAAVGAPSGTEMTVVGLGWDVNLTAIGTSWQSELAVSFDTGDANEEVWLRPGIATNAPGTGSYSSGGIIMLSSIPLPNIVVSDGVLPMEFFESFDDGANSIDGTWNSGSLALMVSYNAVPEPTTLGLLALGSLISLRRARRA